MANRNLLRTGAFNTWGTLWTFSFSVGANIATHTQSVARLLKEEERRIFFVVLPLLVCECIFDNFGSGQKEKVVEVRARRRRGFPVFPHARTRAEHAKRDDPIGPFIHWWPNSYQTSADRSGQTGGASAFAVNGRVLSVVFAFGAKNGKGKQFFGGVSFPGFFWPLSVVVSEVNRQESHKYAFKSIVISRAEIDHKSSEFSGKSAAAVINIFRFVRPCSVPGLAGLFFDVFRGKRIGWKRRKTPLVVRLTAC